MHIVQIHIQVKSEFIEAFKAITVENAKNSIQEPGILRFDVFQQTDDLASFILIEVYRTTGDTIKHKETNHYNNWRQLAEPMMAEPRTRTLYTNIFPDDQVY